MVTLLIKKCGIMFPAQTVYIFHAAIYSDISAHRFGHLYKHSK